MVEGQPTEARTVKALAFLLALPLAAQAPLGSWSLAGAPDIPGIIEAATASMNFVTRPIARSRLRKTNPAYQSIRLERNGGDYLITFDARQAQRMPASGAPVPWRREDGEEFLISIRVADDDLVQRFKADDGVRTNLFHVDPATRNLTLTVTVTSEKLPKPVVYAITYKAAP
jgi:hypothetical protein